MKTRALVVTMVVLAVSCAVAAELPTAEELKEKVVKAYATMTSFEADTRVTYQDVASGLSHLAMEKTTKGNKTVEKSSISCENRDKDAAGNETKEEVKTVDDGTFLWTEKRRAGVILVTKRSAEGHGKLSEFLALGMTANWKRDNLKITGEDTLDGQKMYVLEGTGTAATINKEVMEHKVKIWVGQDDFIVHRQGYVIRLAGKEHPLVNTTDYLSVKVNQPVDPKLFEYTPPDGAKIDDQTKAKP